MLLFLPSLCSLRYGGWDAANHISVLSVCSLLGSANWKGRRREQKLAPSYLSADFAIVSPLASKRNWFQFPTSFHAPNQCHHASQMWPRQPGSTPSSEVCAPGAFPPGAWGISIGTSSEIWVPGPTGSPRLRGLLTPTSSLWFPAPGGGSCFLKFLSLWPQCVFFLSSPPIPLEPISFFKFSAKIARVVYLLHGP